MVVTPCWWNASARPWRAMCPSRPAGAAKRTGALLGAGRARSPGPPCRPAFPVPALLDVSADHTGIEPYLRSADRGSMTTAQQRRVLRAALKNAAADRSQSKVGTNRRPPTAGASLGVRLYATPCLGRWFRRLSMSPLPAEGSGRPSPARGARAANAFWASGRRVRRSKRPHVVWVSADARRR